MIHLFTSNFEGSRTLKRLGATLLIAIIVIVGCDLALGHLLKESPNILHGYRTDGIESLWKINEQGLRPIVFVGSSQVEFAISPHLFDQHLRDRTNQTVISVNVGLNGFQAALTYQEVKGVVIPATPSVLIYGIEMRALNGRNLHNSAAQAITNSLLGYEFQLEPGIEQSILLWLLRHSALVRYAKQYQRWFGEDAFNLYDDRGHLVQHSVSKQPSFIYMEYTNFQVSEPLNEAVLGIGDLCHRQKIPCILLNLPVHQNVYQIVSLQEAALYLETLRSLAAQMNIPLWDFNTASCRAKFQDSEYLDLNHLNESGAQKFTPMVADLYGQELGGQKLSADAEATCADIRRSVPATSSYSRTRWR